MDSYLYLLKDVLDNGSKRKDRTGTGTLSVFGRQLRFDLNDGFPLLTTKRLHFESILHELIWFLSGETNIRYLKKNNVSIWDEWADENGDLGDVYGKQWRAWETNDGRHIDQIEGVIEQIQNNPNSRRLLVNAWNVGVISRMALPPCHFAFQFYVNERKLSCMFSMRSIDIFLGLPFNIASYALLTHMVAEQCDLAAGDLIWSGGDVHLYVNHIEQAREQIARTPYKLPELQLKTRPKCIFEYKHEDFQLVDYRAHPHIPAPIAV